MRVEAEESVNQAWPVWEGWAECVSRSVVYVLSQLAGKGNCEQGFFAGVKEGLGKVTILLCLAR